jgi:hypothetical protein
MILKIAPEVNKAVLYLGRKDTQDRLRDNSCRTLISQGCALASYPENRLNALKTGITYPKRFLRIGLRLSLLLLLKE